jgi:hypothetical protein
MGTVAHAPAVPTTDGPARHRWLVWPVYFVVFAAPAGGCGASFDPASRVESVRILAAQADQPFAKPGETVALKLLAYDGRPDAAGRTMRLSWIPTPCVDPQDDLYYSCFSGPGNPFEGLPSGSDLSSVLPGGDTFSFPLPGDVIDRHPPTAGAPPYGLAIVFSVACAGHVAVVPLGPNRQDPPIGCFDDAGRRLGPSDYVISFTRVYAYGGLSNTNPVIDALLFADQAVDPSAGITVNRCATSNRSDCPKVKIDTVVPSSSQEDDPLDHDPTGAARKERIWVDYYATGGDFGDDLRLLYDSRTGAVSGTDTTFSSPENVGSGFLWTVVHDNRGGVSWLEVPLHVQ